ncbi:MAG: type VI secretion system lipoprotein TssJ [Desulfovibrio sp.]|jgi:type VI secretion system VasD/TssJ family lipoprotein|nr:type VI secretion system lipoprotein TssJ [Desulfovibrio sp.]
MKKVYLVFYVTVLILCLAGCGAPQLSLKVASLPNVNPDNSERPSPVLLKVYELRQNIAFTQGDFQSLFEHPVQTLGADLIAADEMVFIPGEARNVIYHPTLSTRYVGILAGFRQMERAKWRFIRPLDAEKDSIIALELNDVTILPIPDTAAKRWEPEEAVRQFRTDSGKATGTGPRQDETSEAARRPAPERPTTQDVHARQENSDRDTLGTYQDNSNTASKPSDAKKQTTNSSPVRQMSRNP